MPPIPPSVAADQIILASWGNAVRAALNATLGRITQAGQLLVGSGSDDITALDPPSTQSVLQASSAGAISWLAAGSVNAATWIQDRTITRTQIANATIRAAQIGATTITGAKIAGRTITGAKLATNTVTATELANAVTDDIAAGVAAGTYRTNLAVQTKPTPPAGFSVGTQAITLRGADDPLNIDPGLTARVTITVHGDTLAFLIGNGDLHRYTIYTNSIVSRGSRSTVSGATRGLFYYDDGYYLVQANSSTVYVYLVSEFTSNNTFSSTISLNQTLLGNTRGAAATANGFLVLSGTKGADDSVVKLFSFTGDFQTEYSVVGIPASTVGSTTADVAVSGTHFYVFIKTDTTTFTAYAYRLADGTADTNANFDINEFDDNYIRGAVIDAISDGYVWLTGGDGPILRVLLPTDDYRETINGVLTTRQPNTGDMYTLSSTADGIKWLRQTQLSL